MCRTFQAVMVQQQESRRLVISSMVLENFKSYAGAQRVGPFHKVRGQRDVRISAPLTKGHTRHSRQNALLH